MNIFEHEEIILSIAMNSPIKTLNNLCFVNKPCYHVLMNQYFWKQKYLKDYY